MTLQRKLKNLDLLSLLTPAMVDPWTLEGLEDYLEQEILPQRVHHRIDSDHKEEKLKIDSELFCKSMMTWSRKYKIIDQYTKCNNLHMFYVYRI